jgi:hypothetical protein
MGSEHTRFASAFLFPLSTQNLEQRPEIDRPCPRLHNRIAP